MPSASRMRISELSRRASVPLSTIKFYIRENLLPAGTPIGRNQARYGPDHLERLDLIRALQEAAGLSLDVVREVLAQLDKPIGDRDPAAAASAAIYRVPERDRDAAEQARFEALRTEVEEVMRGLDWVVDDPALCARLQIKPLADAIAQTRKYLDPDYSAEELRRYADLAWQLSAIACEGQEDRIPERKEDLGDATRAALLGGLLLEKMFGALLRAALAVRSAHALSAGKAP